VLVLKQKVYCKKKKNSCSTIMFLIISEDCIIKYFKI